MSKFSEKLAQATSKTADKEEVQFYIEDSKEAVQEEIADLKKRKKAVQRTILKSVALGKDASSWVKEIVQAKINIKEYDIKIATAEQVLEEYFADEQ
jgi:hypothetical protein